MPHRSLHSKQMLQFPVGNQTRDEKLAIGTDLNDNDKGIKMELQNKYIRLASSQRRPQ